MARPLIANNDLVEVFRRGQDRADKPCSYCNRCLVNVVENPLGCYDEDAVPVARRHGGGDHVGVRPAAVRLMATTGDREGSMDTTKLAQETIPPDEAATIAAFIAFLKETSAARAVGTPAGIRRFNQARASGCMDAEFIVPADLPARLEGGALRAGRHLRGPHAVRQRHVR